MSDQRTGDRRVPSNWTILKSMTFEHLVTVASFAIGGAILWTQMVAKVEALETRVANQESQLQKIEDVIPPLNTNLTVVSTKLDVVQDDLKWLRTELTRRQAIGKE